MLFNSAEFLFAFLPITWIVWRILAGLGRTRTALGALTLASLGFYLWWDLQDLPDPLRTIRGFGTEYPVFLRAITPTLLLGSSLLINFLLGRALAAKPGARRGLLVLGLLWNLGFLCYFKYWDFFAGNLNALSGLALSLVRLALPLGISFFTFQKIAFLVDAWRGRVREVRFGEFACFVLFFPQLIAGPIVHHGEFIPQLRDPGTFRLDLRRFTLGLTVFAAGLFQKVFIADSLAPIADSAFGLADLGVELRLVEAWVGLLAYSLQLYFDFSGYSVMALGLALLFGLRLPVNFLAPYQATSLIDFWRRWHITLSAFLRDYVYIPLGGNRHGFPRQLTALALTMLLAGLWHGAGWTFVLWGAWHAAFLCLNHGWRHRLEAAGHLVAPSLRGRLATLAVVILGWVLFRSPDLATAWTYFLGLFGGHGVTVPVTWAEWVEPINSIVRARGLFPNIAVTPDGLLILAVAAVAALAGPSLPAWLGLTRADMVSPPRFEPLAPDGSFPPLRRAVVTGLMFVLALGALGRESPFLYFQF